MDLTPSQWTLLSPLVAPQSSVAHRGRPHHDARAVLNGIFWVLRTGARWSDLPERYPPYQTCHRRFRAWHADGTLFACFKLLDADLRDRARTTATPLPQPSDPRSPSDDFAPLITHGGINFPASSRSWGWNTALLLQCALAREALAAGDLRKERPGETGNDEGRRLE